VTTPILLLVLAAAALHAIWNALVKHGADPVFRLGIVALTGSAIALPLLPFVTVPSAASWPWLLGSLAAHVGYYVTLAFAYRTGELSIVYPVARGVAPPLVALGGVTLAGEHLLPAQLFAVGLICGGILLLVLLGQATRNGLHSLWLAVGCGLTIAAYTLCDGIAGRLSGDPLGYIVWLFLLDGSFGVAVLWFRRETLGSDLRRGVLPSIAGGALSMLAYGLVIWAMTMAPMALVSAVRETSVVLAAAIGCWMMGEGLGTRRVASAALVAFGIVALKLW
jgi:drug/metabolite transporter (DMT)-like permease